MFVALWYWLKTGTVLMIVLCLYRSHSICSTCWWDLFKPWWSLLSSGTRSAPHVWPAWQPWPSCCLYRPVLESSSASSGQEMALLWSLMYMFAKWKIGLFSYTSFIFAGAKRHFLLTTESASWTKWCLASGSSRCTRGRNHSQLWSLKSGG